MSAELYDADQGSALARPAIDILPTPGGRKAKPAPVEEQAALPEPEPAPAEWAAPLAQAPNPWSDSVATPAPVAPPQSYAPLDLPEGADPLVSEPEAPKRFLGMQVRRAKKVSEPTDVETTALDPAAAYPASAPLAAWPTDVAMPVVAHAEPAQQAAAGPADLVPVEAVEIPVAPVADDSEVRALRAMVEASEAGRVEAENRASLAVAYAQAAQAQLTDASAKAQAQIQAAEARARVAANDAQDWQIRHREADATIAELAVSVASAEQRMSELRVERDELLASLEDATKPDHQPSASS